MKLLVWVCSFQIYRTSLGCQRIAMVYKFSTAGVFETQDFFAFHCNMTGCVAAITQVITGTNWMFHNLNCNYRCVRSRTKKLLSYKMNKTRSRERIPLQ